MINYHLLLLHLHFQLYSSFLILTTLVLKPDPDDPRTESRHLYQLLLHQSIRSRVGGVTSSETKNVLLISGTACKL